MDRFLNKYKIHLLIFFLATVIFCVPILKNINNWGINDWDQAIFWRALPRLSILEYKQFPFWNPYANGGNVHFAHPNSSFLDPFFICILFFGPVIGLKIEILLYFFIGLLGTYLLGKFFKASTFGSYLVASIYMFSSYLSLHLAEGDPHYLQMAITPWVFLFYLKSLQFSKQIIISIIFFLLMQFSGSDDIFSAVVFFIFIYSILKSIELRNFKPLTMWIILIIGTFLLGAVKFIPMINFIKDYPRYINDPQGARFNIFYHMFLDRNQVELFLASFKNTIVGLDPDYQKKFGLLSSWPSYGFYIGFIPLGLLLLGLILNSRKQWPLILTGFTLFMIILGSKSPLKIIWIVLHQIPIYSNLRPCSGHAGNFILVIAIIIGLCFTRLQSYLTKFCAKYIKIKTLNNVLFISILIYIFFDLISVAWPIFNAAFVVKPIYVKENKKFHHIREFIGFDDRLMRSAMYPALLANRGQLNSYETIQIQQSDKIKYIDNNKGKLDNWLFLAIPDKIPGHLIEKNLLNSTVQYNYIYKFNSKELRWVEYTPEVGIMSSYLFFDLTQVPYTKAYLMTYIYIPKKQMVTLTLGRDSGIVMWCNQKKIFEDGYKNTKRDTEYINFSLNKGWNKMLIKLYRHNRYDKWRLIQSVLRDQNSNTRIIGIVYNAYKEEINTLEDIDEIHFINKKGEAIIKQWSPNLIVAELVVNEEDVIILNQNYYKGWRVRGLDNSYIIPWNGLISARVFPGRYKVKFYYISPGFYLGFFITAITAILMSYSYYKIRWRK